LIGCIDICKSEEFFLSFIVANYKAMQGIRENFKKIQSDIVVEKNADTCRAP